MSEGDVIYRPNYFSSQLFLALIGSNLGQSFLGDFLPTPYIFLLHQQFFENSKFTLVNFFFYVCWFFFLHAPFSYPFSKAPHSILWLVWSRWTIAVVVRSTWLSSLWVLRCNGGGGKFFLSASWTCDVINIRIGNPYETYVLAICKFHTD